MLPKLICLCVNFMYVEKNLEYPQIYFSFEKLFSHFVAFRKINVGGILTDFSDKEWTI